ncbi:MAG: class II aldolase/adducin family protein, partial [Spirochaetota bacterium]
RPSVETLFHAMQPQKYVIHTHPALINGLTCGRTGKEFALKLFGTRVVWVPTVNPGYILALTTKEILQNHVHSTGLQPDIIFLQNHGVFAASDTPEGIQQTYELMTATLEKKVQRFPDFTPAERDEHLLKTLKTILSDVMEETGAGALCRFGINKEIDTLLKDRSTVKPVLSTALSPDHIIYCGREPLLYNLVGDAIVSPAEAKKDLKKAFSFYRERNRKNPKIVAILSFGFFACGSNRQEVDAAYDLFLDAVKVSVYAESFGGLSIMPPDQVDFIEQWEVEKYRQKISLGKS